MSQRRRTIRCFDLWQTWQDGRAAVLLERSGEARFGPAYYDLWLGFDAAGANPTYVCPGHVVYREATFAFSPDGRFLIFARWPGGLRERRTDVVGFTTEARYAHRAQPKDSP